jgi:hypothetical protein
LKLTYTKLISNGNQNVKGSFTNIFMSLPEFQRAGDGALQARKWRKILRRKGGYERKMG